MIFDKQNDKFVFTQGRSVYANCGIIGIDPNLQTFDGYDGNFDREWTVDGNTIYSTLSRSEKLELACYMISLWARYKDNI